MVDWDYDQYRQIIQKYAGNAVTWTAAANLDSFTVIRHDVESSMEAALQIAIIDQAIGVPSSFFFQVTSGLYNLASSPNQQVLEKILETGRDVGVHVCATEYPTDSDLTPEQFYLNEIGRQKSLFMEIVGLTPKIFNVHRPSPVFLNLGLSTADGMLNSYGPSFFDYTDVFPSRKIRYLADSRHRWDYGNPLAFSAVGKTQLLLHGEEWTHHGEGRAETLDRILREKSGEAITEILAERTVER